MVLYFYNSTWVLFNANYVWQIYIWSWFPMIFFLQTWNLNLRTKCFGVLAIYFHGLKGRNPNHEQKQNQITKETARDTHLSHSSIPPDNTLRIINCTNRIISMSKKLCACLEKSAFFKKYFHYEFPKKCCLRKPVWNSFGKTMTSGKHWHVTQWKKYQQRLARVRSE